MNSCLPHWTVKEILNSKYAIDVMREEEHEHEEEKKRIVSIE